MGTSIVPDILAIVLFLITLFVSLRSFYIYSQVQTARLFILGLSMGIIALTAVADFLSSHITSMTLNTDWFLYIGQSCSFLFILLSFFGKSNEYFQRLMRTHILVSVLLIGILFLSVTLPDIPGVPLHVILSGSRSLVCFGIFYCYISAFMNKPTRFSLLMSISFALLGFGYLTLVQKYFIANGAVLDNAGDILRLFGLIALLVAVLE